MVSTHPTLKGKGLTTHKNLKKSFQTPWKTQLLALTRSFIFSFFINLKVVLILKMLYKVMTCFNGDDGLYMKIRVHFEELCGVCGYVFYLSVNGAG